MSGESFELTPFGIRPIDSAPVAASDAVIPGGLFLKTLAAQKHSAPVVRVVDTSAAPPGTKTAALKPRDVVKAARARIREIKAELRGHATLKRELVELQRLVKAAKEKPRANVRAIDSARRAV